MGQDEHLHCEGNEAADVENIGEATICKYTNIWMEIHCKLVPPSSVYPTLCNQA